MLGSKIVSLSEAVNEVRDGDITLFGGLIDARRPMAAMFEIMRQQKKNLIALAFVALEDPLIGAGCIGGVHGCYTHMGIFGKAPCLQRAVKENKLIINDIGHADSMLAIIAGAYGLPFVGSPYSLGTDVLNPAYSKMEELRAIARNKEKIPAIKSQVTKNPFNNQNQNVVLFPAIRPDIAIIHVQQVGTEGTCRIDGVQGYDAFGALAADKVIITAEQIVPEELLRRDPNRNLIPCTEVDMIVEVPYGAHPSLVPNHYDLDLEFIKQYQAAAKTKAGFDRWADEWVYSIKSQTDFIQKLGAAKLQKLRTVEPFGFSPRAGITQLLETM